jgi:Outer membrane protein beta-barrel domain
MKLAKLIAIVAITSILNQSSIFAQEVPDSTVVPTVETPAEKLSEKPPQIPANPPVREKKYSIGPAIEFGGGGTNFGIAGKYNLGEQFSIRPLILFGRKTTVSNSNLTKSLGGSYTASDINSIANLVDNFSGIGYGVAATYNFKSLDNKIAGYIGPRILSSGVSVTGTKGFTPVQIDITEINVGLTAGADFALTPDLSAGLNATYNFYRGVRIDSSDIQNLGSTTNFGVNFTYSF